MDNVKLYTIFRAEIVTVAREVDPGEELDWFALTVGWAIAKGLTPSEAHDFSIYARYERHYE